jgi:hypothetical protein
MYEVIESELPIKYKECEIGTVTRKQDYSKILFELSRSDEPIKREDAFTVVVGRDWCGDVSRYIADLENEIKGMRLT